MASRTLRTVDTEVAAMARTYAEMGWKVFPLWWITRTGDGCVGLAPECACPLGAGCKSPGKHPIPRLQRFTGGHDWLAPNGVKDASDDLSVIERWWSLAPHANIGLPAHANGLAIIDVDPRHQGHLSWWRLLVLLIDTCGPDGWPATVVQTTGSGGEHHLFAAPEGGISSTKKAFGDAYPGLDTRGRGGYVVVAPSTHVSGDNYGWASPGFMRRHLLDDGPLPPWPAALDRVMAAVPATVADARAALDIYTERRRPAPQADPVTVAAVAGWTPGTPKYVAVAVAAELDKLRGTGEGGRNDQLNRAAYAVGRFVPVGLLDEQVAFGELCRAGLAAGLTREEIPKTVLSGLAAGKARPARHLPATRASEA
jgi:hypothetical protein